MRLVGYQPQYFPRLHYFNRVLNADVFEVSDYVQFVKKHAFPVGNGKMKRGVSYQAHTPIKLSQGEFLLVVPTHDGMLAINKTQIDYSRDWAQKMLKSLEVGYRKSLNYVKFFPELETLLTHKYDNLSDLTLRSTLWGIARIVSDDPINFKTFDTGVVSDLLQSNKHPFRLRRIFLASESPVPAPEKGRTNEWLIELCKYAGATEYFFGGTSHSAYMDLEKINKAGIKTELQEWKCADYPQQYMKIGFLPNLSLIDLIMNADLKKRQEILV